MKATELNGSHLGQHVTVKVGTASVTDTIRGYSASADLIQDGPFFARVSTRPNYALGRQTLTIDFLTAGSIQVDPDSEVTIHEQQRAPQPTGRHRITEDHNTDPVCACGWDPAKLFLGIRDREAAREAIRDHILDRGAQ